MQQPLLSIWPFFARFRGGFFYSLKFELGSNFVKMNKLRAQQVFSYQTLALAKRKNVPSNFLQKVLQLSKGDHIMKLEGVN